MHEIDTWKCHTLIYRGYLIITSDLIASNLIVWLFNKFIIINNIANMLHIVHAESPWGDIHGGRCKVPGSPNCSSVHHGQLSTATLGYTGLLASAGPV